MIKHRIVQWPMTPDGHLSTFTLRHIWTRLCETQNCSGHEKCPTALHEIEPLLFPSADTIRRHSSATLPGHQLVLPLVFPSYYYRKAEFWTVVILISLSRLTRRFCSVYTVNLTKATDDRHTVVYKQGCLFGKTQLMWNMRLSWRHPRSDAV